MKQKSTHSMERGSSGVLLSALRPTLLAVFGVSFFINVLMFVGPLYMLQVYDRVLTSRNENTLIVLTVIAVGLLIAYGLLELARNLVLHRLGVRFDTVIAPKVFSMISQNLALVPPAAREKLLQDVKQIRDVSNSGAVSSVCDAPWAPIFLVACFVIHPWLGWVATFGALIILATALVNEISTRRAMTNGNQAIARADWFAGKTLQRAETARSMGLLDGLKKRWVDLHLHGLLHQLQAGSRSGALLAFAKFIRMSMQIAILGLGAFLVILNDITPGAMIAASIIMARALAPLEGAVSQWKVMTTGRQAFERLSAFFDRCGPVTTRTIVPDVQGRLEIENLAIIVPNTQETILRGVNLLVEPGDMVAIVGPSAAGKSSLARCIAGVWQPAAGTVRLDGSELCHWDSDQLGQTMGYLPQEIDLYEGTVAENIARFKTADDDAITAAAKAADVHNMLQRLADGYETPLSDGASELSGGQRQRIALARALFGNPNLIVLDEPNANLDQAGEEALIAALQGLKRAQISVILVTHKANLIRCADRVFVVDHGTGKEMPTVHPTNHQSAKTTLALVETPVGISPAE